MISRRFDKLIAPRDSFTTVSMTLWEGFAELGTAQSGALNYVSHQSTARLAMRPIRMNLRRLHTSARHDDSLRRLRR
jgi:hypothetical protein